MEEGESAPLFPFQEQEELTRAAVACGGVTKLSFVPTSTTGQWRKRHELAYIAAACDLCVVQASARTGGLILHLSRPTAQQRAVQMRFRALLGGGLLNGGSECNGKVWSGKETQRTYQNTRTLLLR
jgi:hypothetical protein